MRIARTSFMAGLVGAVAFGIVGCAIEPPSAGPQATPASVVPTVAVTTPVAASPTVEATAVPTVAASVSASFMAVVDGDTVETSEGTVRIIGIDTPERGECGHPEASAAIGRVVFVGEPVALVLPEGQNNFDRHDRLIRYVITEAGVDLGLMQLEAGNAIARYDSTDGYPAHPRQSSYHAAQIASSAPDGSVLTIACQGEPTQGVAPFTGQTDDDDRWWTRYTSCSKLKKNSAGHPTGPFRKDDPREAAIYDWFANGTGNRGDGDSDGLACE